MIGKLLKPRKLPHANDDGLETLEQYCQRWRSIRIVYFTIFLMSLGFSIVVTGVWPYLNKLDPSAGKDFMGFIIAANPLGQMLFSPIFGWWSNKMNSIRWPMAASLVLFAGSSSLYSMLELRPSHVKYWMLASRFLVGVSSANIAVCRAYLSAATRLNERTHAVSMISLAQVVGFIVGPALQAFVTPLGKHGYVIFAGGVHFNMYTACGWINLLLSIANLYMFSPSLFQERKVAAREIMRLQGKSSERETWKAIKPNYISACTLLVAFFVMVFNFVLLETLGTSLAMDQFAWSNNEALYYMGILMSIGAIVALTAFALINTCCKYFPERYVLIWGGFFVMVVGTLLFLPMGDSPPKLAEVYNVTVQLSGDPNIDPAEDDPIFVGCPKTQLWCTYTPALTLTQFIIGYMLNSIGYPIGITLIQTIFSKVLGPRPQGVWMGFMSIAGCFSRVLGPVFVGTIYTHLGTIWTFGATSSIMFISMIWLLCCNKYLISPTFERHEPVEMLVINSNNAQTPIEFEASKPTTATTEPDSELLTPIIGI